MQRREAARQRNVERLCVNVRPFGNNGEGFDQFQAFL